MSEVIEQEPVVEEAAPVEGEIVSESASEDTQEPQEGEVKPKGGGFQKRIDRLTREKSDLARENEVLRQLALRTTPPQVETPKPTSVAEPSENDFGTHSEYVRALTKWTAAEAVEEFKASQRTESAKTQQQTVQQEFKTRQDAFRTATPDFDEVLADADFPVSQALLSEIVESEKGPELQYFLARNPDEAERLSKLAPLKLAREVGKIESRFTTSPVTKTVKTTAAPPPPTPTGKSSSTSTKDPGEMNPAEYKVWRAKQ